MKKRILITVAGLLALSPAMGFAVNDASKPLHKVATTSVVKQEKSLDGPNYVTGAINYYCDTRDPTSSEPTINPGLLVPEQLLFWKNTTMGTLFLLKSSVDNGDGTYTLSWAQFTEATI